MWATSSPGDKLTGDFGNEPDATSISDRGLFRLLREICHPAFSDFCNTIGTELPCFATLPKGYAFYLILAEWRLRSNPRSMPTRHHLGASTPLSRSRERMLSLAHFPPPDKQPSAPLSTHASP